MTLTAATELQVGDTFQQRRTGKSYTVVSEVTAHRDEYAKVFVVKSLTTGNEATVAFQADANVWITK